jgi:Fur family ferric uptake transcriptional regulator
MMEEEVLKKLEQLDLRKTAIRKEVLQLFFKYKGRALGSREIEEALGHADRITLYRTLRTFEQSGVIHQAVDGTGAAKYALCLDDCTTHEHHDEHAHFHCTRCGRTICLEGKLDLKVKAPRGYRVHHAHLVLEGECADCANSN